MSLLSLIPAPYRLVVAGLVVVTLMALSAAAAWEWQANSYGVKLADQHAAHLDHLRQTAEANASVIHQQQADRLALEGRLAQLDTQSTEQLTHAQSENARLEHLYSAADNERRRLRIEVTLARNDAIVSATSSTGGVGDAATVELSAVAGQSVWDLRRALIEDREKIRYLQGYVCQIRPEAPGCP